MEPVPSARQLNQPPQPQKSERVPLASLPPLHRAGADPAPLPRGLLALCPCCPCPAQTWLCPARPRCRHHGGGHGVGMRPMGRGRAVLTPLQGPVAGAEVLLYQSSPLASSTGASGDTAPTRGPHPTAAAPGSPSLPHPNTEVTALGSSCPGPSRWRRRVGGSTLELGGFGNGLVLPGLAPTPFGAGGNGSLAPQRGFLL